MPWITSTEALATLGTKPQSLYASVSRGRIRTRPDPDDPRRRLYDRDDILRLAHRAGGRRRNAAVAAETIAWGEPVLATTISSVAGGRLTYRGHDAIELAATATLEDVAALLWETEPVRFVGRGAPRSAGRKDAFRALADRAAADPATLGLPLAVLRESAAPIVATLADAFGATADSLPLHRCLAAGWRRPEAAHTIRRALVLLAEHELNASTFAVRIAASTGASLAAATLAGLAVLSGPRHGGAAAEVAALAATPEKLDKRWLADQALPGFGHRLYPGGDPRATTLLADLAPPPAFATLAAHGRNLSGEAPNVDFALAAIAAAFDLPPDAPFMLFALARSVGWLAHAFEQIETGTLIRPRAEYAGSATAG